MRWPAFVWDHTCAFFFAFWFLQGNAIFYPPLVFPPPSTVVCNNGQTTEDEAARQDLKKQLMARAEALNNQRTLTSNHRDAIRAMLIHTNNNTAVVNEVRLQQWELSFGNWLFRSALFSPIVFALTEVPSCDRLVCACVCVCVCV